MNQTDNPAQAPRRPWRALRLVSLVALALLIVYALGGFFVAPWAAQREVQKMAEQEWRRNLRIGSVHFNPFSLALRLQEVALEEKDGRPLLSFREANVNLQWSSLARRAWILSELTLTEPSLHIEISEEGELNLAAVVPQGSGSSAGQGPVRLAIERLSIAGGRVDFVDQREGYRNALEHLSLELSAVSTLDARNGPHVLSAETRDGAKLRWQGQLALQPLTASGVLALQHSALPQLNPYFDEQMTTRFTAGRADVELPYRFSIVEGKPQLEIEGARLSMQDVALALRDGDKPFATVPRATLEGIAFNLQERRILVDALRARDFTLAVVRNEDGELDIARIFPAEAERSEPAPWRFAIASVELDNGSLSLDDRATRQTIQLNQWGTRLTGVSSEREKPLGFEFSAVLGKGGRIEANGTAGPQEGTVQAHVAASGLPLTLLQPLLAQRANVTLVAGELALKGELRIGGEGARAAYTGSAAATNVAIDDAGKARLLAWKSLATPALRASLGPDRAEIDELRWIAPAGRFAIAADGTTNIGRAFKARPQEEASERAAGDRGATGDTGFAVTVRRIRVEQGRLEFSDESLTPGFVAHIEELAGTLNGISSDRATRSQLSLEGRVDQHGFARLSGSINLFEPSERTNLRVVFRNLDVVKVSPYTVKFAGYRVASGRMSLDLNYRVRDKTLEGDNQIVLEHFTLGERVESPNALQLPLELAVALLKDSNGVIDVAVPISGNLDDPQFDYGALIRKAIANLITGIVTAPFRALARLFGGREDAELGSIAFEPGASRLLPPEREKLARIAQALSQRPELKLVIPPAYDPESDARALKRGALRRELAKRAGFDVGDEDPPGPLSIEDQRTRNALRALFAERFSESELDRLRSEAEAKAAASGDKSKQDIGVLERLRKLARGEPQVADASDFYRTLGRRLLDSQPLPEGALEALAQRRAAALVAALKEAGVDPARMATAKPEPSGERDAKQVKLQLSLAPMQ